MSEENKMKYYFVYNTIGKTAVKAFNSNHALKKYCIFNGMFSIPEKWYTEEITKEEYENFYYKIN